jgi:hypothetical protein
LLSSAGFLKAPNKFSERQLDGIADCLEIEHIDSSFTLFVFADTRLSYSKDFRQLCLGQFRFYSNAPQQAEEYLSITLRSAQSFPIRSMHGA